MTARLSNRLRLLWQARDAVFATCAQASRRARVAPFASASRVAALVSAAALLAMAGGASAQAHRASGAPGYSGTVELRPIDRATVRVIAIGGAYAMSFESERTKVHRVVAIPRSGHGTGAVVSSDGLILTARHVVEGADFVAVLLPGSDRPMSAVVVYADPDHDIAVLHVRQPMQHVLSVPARPRTLRLSERLFASGYPLDVRERFPAAVSGELSRENRDGALQAAISVNPGNSGGPVIDSAGELIGIVVRRGSPQEGIEGIALLEPLRFVLPALRSAAAIVRRSPPRHPTDGELLARIIADFVRTSDERPIFEQTAWGLIEKGAAQPTTPEAALVISAHAWNMHVALLEARKVRDAAALSPQDKALADRLAQTALRLARHYSDQAPYLRSRYGIVRSLLFHGGRSFIEKPTEK